MAYLLFGPADMVILAFIVCLLLSPLPLLGDWRDHFRWMEHLRLRDPVRWQRYQFQHLMYLRELLKRQEQRPMDWRPWLIFANVVLAVMLVLLLLDG